MAFSAARGAGLVALAVILGIVLLQVVDDGTSGPAGDGGGGAPVTTTTEAGDTDVTTTTAAVVPEPRPPAELTVQVLNGGAAAGAAGALTAQLAEAGYQTVEATDTTPRTGNVVLFQAGLEREAATLATLVGEGTVVEPAPEPPPAGAGDVDLVVVLGGTG